MSDEPEVTDGAGAGLDGINAEEVTRRIERLREAWADPAVETWRESAKHYGSLHDDATDGYLGGAYVWIVRDPGDAPELTESMPEWAETHEEHALMILGRGATAWGLPGGGRESGESFEDAAVREVDEEVGVDCELVDCFLLRRCVVTDPDGERPSIHFLQAFFDGAYRGGTITVQSGELNGAAWFATPPEEVAVNPANERRAESFFE